MTDTLSNTLPSSVEDLAEEVLERAHAAKLTLATAESCTGGLLASVLTDVTGLSHVFDRGFVVYSTSSKQTLPGLTQDLLDTHSAVSEEVARVMAEGALATSDADLAVSVTGYAGPGGKECVEGLVHFAVASGGRRTRHAKRMFGPLGRGPIRVKCIETALELLSDAIADRS